jgi:hypothetical protein
MDLALNYNQPHTWRERLIQSWFYTMALKMPNKAFDHVLYFAKKYNSKIFAVSCIVVEYKLVPMD